MSASKNYYVTTSIPYINGEPHLGHAMEFVMGDVLARSARKSKQHKSVLFSIGTDEHGGKIAEKAKELGIKPEELADKMSKKFRELSKSLNISHDRFIRTTDKGHIQRAQLIWKTLEKDIYKGKYEGWYCTGCEEYVSDATAKQNNGVCPEHNRKYERLEEENYFFKLTKYTDEIHKKIESGALQVLPITRRNEVLSWLKQGVEDISISRPKDKISWGIPVPGDKNQIMYVWYEALMNYITVLGYPEHEDFKAFWPANVQVVGKGISRFHAIIWPGMLLALGVDLPKQLYVHGYITVENQKMSKSLGNSVAPSEIIDKFSADAFRYFFLRHIPSNEDGDFSWEKFESAYNGELANELGNAVSRTAAMITQYQSGVIGDIPEAEHDVALYAKALEGCHFDRALDVVWQQVRGVNQLIEEEKPWELAKNNDTDHLREVLASLASDLLEIADLLEPFMPKTSEKIKHVFNTGIIRPIEGTLFPKHDTKPTTSDQK